MTTSASTTSPRRMSSSVVVAVKTGRENDPAIVALVKALQSEEIRDWVAKTYPDGNVVVVF